MSEPESEASQKLCKTSRKVCDYLWELSNLEVSRGIMLNLLHHLNVLCIFNLSENIKIHNFEKYYKVIFTQIHHYILNYIKYILKHKIYEYFMRNCSMKNCSNINIYVSV